ncbi:glycosyltransferase, partial [Mycolicibacterium thermoresistibile]
MKIAMASYGTRGDIEPSVAVGRALQRRGHEVRIAVPPDLLSFAESAGLSAIPYGMHIEPQLDSYRDLWSTWVRRFWRVQDLVQLSRESLNVVTQQWADMSKTLMTVAEGADVLTTGVGYEQAAANVAEYYDIPMVAFHTFFWRPNGRLVPFVPPPVTRTAMTVYDWAAWW